jgi:hypothetical protein
LKKGACGAKNVHGSLRRFQSGETYTTDRFARLTYLMMDGKAHIRPEIGTATSRKAPVSISGSAKRTSVHIAYGALLKLFP